MPVVVWSLAYCIGTLLVRNRYDGLNYSARHPLTSFQIAAILDRSFAQDRTFMFWNIVITHLLAVRTMFLLLDTTDLQKTSPQAPPEKKKLYGMLALKQIQRAAQLAEQVVAILEFSNLSLIVLGRQQRCQTPSSKHPNRRGEPTVLRCHRKARLQGRL